VNLTFLKPGSKHGGHLLNEIFVDSKDITPSSGYLKAWGIFQMTIFAPLRQKMLSRTHIQGIVSAAVSMIDRRSVRVTEIDFSSNGASHD